MVYFFKNEYEYVRGGGSVVGVRRISFFIHKSHPRWYCYTSQYLVIIMYQPKSTAV